MKTIHVPKTYLPTLTPELMQNKTKLNENILYNAIPRGSAP